MAAALHIWTFLTSFVISEPLNVCAKPFMSHLIQRCLHLCMTMYFNKDVRSRSSLHGFRLPPPWTGGRGGAERSFKAGSGLSVQAGACSGV